MISAPLDIDTDQIMALTRSRLVVAVKLTDKLLADAQVSSLTRLLAQTLQLIDVAVTLVLEGESGVRVELAQSPGLVGASENALNQGVTKPCNRLNRYIL